MCDKIYLVNIYISKYLKVTQHLRIQIIMSASSSKVTVWFPGTTTANLSFFFFFNAICLKHKKNLRILNKSDILFVFQLL